MKASVLAVLMGIAFAPAAANAQYISGPKVLGCDVVTADKQSVRTDICLIIAEGNVPGGDYVLAVRVGNSQQTHVFRNTEESAGDVEVYDGDDISSSPAYKTEARESYEPCRATHAPFVRFNILNGMSICLYRSQ